MSDYNPVSCAFYDIFEIAIMRRQRLLIRWKAGGVQTLEQPLIPLDLRILDRAEHLVAQTLDGHQLNLRLDWIDRATPLNQ